MVQLPSNASYGFESFWKGTWIKVVYTGGGQYVNVLGMYILGRAWCTKVTIFIYFIIEIE